MELDGPPPLPDDSTIVPAGPQPAPPSHTTPAGPVTALASDLLTVFLLGLLRKILSLWCDRSGYAPAPPPPSYPRASGGMAPPSYMYGGSWGGDGAVPGGPPMGYNPQFGNFGGGFGGGNGYNGFGGVPGYGYDGHPGAPWDKGGKGPGKGNKGMKGPGKGKGGRGPHDFGGYAGGGDMFGQQAMHHRNDGGKGMPGHFGGPHDMHGHGKGAAGKGFGGAPHFDEGKGGPWQQQHPQQPQHAWPGGWGRGGYGPGQADAELRSAHAAHEKVSWLRHCDSPCRGARATAA